MWNLNEVRRGGPEVAKRWCKDGRINELKVLMGSKGVGIWVYERQSYKVVDCGQTVRYRN